MNFAACIAYLLLIVASGYALVSLVNPPFEGGLFSLSALSAAAGAGATGMILFWASLAGCAPSRTELAWIAGAALACLVLLGRSGRLIRPRTPPRPLQRGDGWILIPVVLAAAGAAVVASGTVSALADWDGFGIWAFKAKVLASGALRPTPDYFHDLTLSYSHLDYPLLVPFLTAGSYAAMGGMDDVTGRLVSVFLDLLLVPLVYHGLRWKLSRAPAACLSALAALLPALLRHAGMRCADVPLAVFEAGSLLYTARWLVHSVKGDLVMAVLFSAFAAFTKNEGLMLALANALVILCVGLRRRGLSAAVAFAAGVLALDAPWLVWRRQLPKTHEDYGAKLLSPLIFTQLSRLKEIVPAMAHQILEFRSWGIFWIAGLALAALGWRGFGQRHLSALWIAFALQLGGYALIYVVTPWPVDLLIPLTIERLFLQAVPAFVLISGWHWAEALVIHRSKTDCRSERLTGFVK